MEGEQHNKIIYKDLSYEITGVLFDVYNQLGPGLPEKVYQNALEIAFQKKKWQFEAQLYSPLEYDNYKVGSCYLDFLIEKKIVLEIKVNKRFTKQDFNQIKKYLKTTGIKLGILATFADQGVKFTRVLNLY
ncbi:MAG: GxxExxY protein [Parcubacteria group bacterium]